MAKRSANNYFKNVAKSIGHTASNSVSNELNSTLDFISSNTSTIREEIGEAKNLKEFIKIKSTPFDEYKKMVKEGLKNAKEDLKTGKFYNQERLESVGMDDDDMFGDDFFDDFEDSFDLGEDVDLDGASITINKIDMNATEKSPLVKATKATTDAIITTSKASNKLMSSLTETTISAIVESNENTNRNLSTVNENIGSLISFNNGIVSKFIESSQKYYEDSLKLLSEQVSELKKLTEPKREEVYKGYDPTQVFLSGGGLDIKSYLGMVKRNTGNVIDETPGLSMIKAMMSDKDNMKLFLASPLQMVTDTIAEKLVPELAKQSMAAFDKTFSEFFPAMLSKISGLRDSDNPLYALAGRIFGVTPNTKSSIDLGNYNKKAVPFDGYVRKSIVEVIPGYLRKIEAALTGREERAFDLAKGKWRSAYGMRDEFDNRVNDAMLSNFYDVRYAMTKNAKFLNANGEDMHLGEKIDKLLLKLSTDSSISGVTTSKSDYGKKGFKDLREILEGLTYDGYSYSQDDINAIIAMYNNLPRNQKMALNGRARQNAIAARKKILEESEQNPYEYNAQFSKYSGDEIDNGRNKNSKNWKTTGIQDKYGQTSLSYLRNIQTMLANGIKVYTVGNGKKGKGSGAYNPNESFLKDMTYQEKRYYDSMNRRSATPLTEEQIARQRSIGTVIFGAGQDFSAEEIQRKLAEVDKPVNPNDNMISKAMDEISKTKAGKMGQSAQEKLNDWKYAVQSVFTAPARMIAGLFDRMDNTLYNIVFGSDDDDDSQSFASKALATFKVKMNDLGDWFKDKLFGKNGLFTQVKESDLYDILGEKGKDVKEKLLGDLDESTGLRSGGILSETSNELHDVTRTMKAFFTGKEWTDSKGVKHEATENAVFPELKKDFNGLKDTVKSYLFGNKEDAEGEGKKGGLVKGMLNSISDGFKTLGDALFGPSEYIATGPDGRAKVYRSKMSAEMKDFGKNLKERAPKMAAGGITGFVGGALAGSSGLGLLGSLFLPGGPIGGAIIGSAAGYLSQSEKFKTWLFGEKNEETGERVGNIISAKTQKFFKENKVPIIGGATMGFLKGTLGIGLLPSFLLPGGPIGGALMGAGFGLLKRSDTFQNFLFGPKNKEGKRRSNKGLLGSIFGKMRTDGDAGKVAGSAAAGAISGAALSSVIGSFGIMGAALTPLGPLGGALAGAALGITAASNKWKERVFGTFNKDTGKKEGGLMGQLRNWTKLNVFAPLKLSGQALALNIKDWFIDGIAMPFMNAVEPIKNAAIGMAVKTKDLFKRAGRLLLGGIDNIFKRIDKRLNGFFGKVGRLIWKGIKGLATNPFKMAGKLISAPFKLAEKAALAKEKHDKKKGLKYYWDLKRDSDGNYEYDENGNHRVVRRKRNIIDRMYGVINREERARRKAHGGDIVDIDGNVIERVNYDDYDERRKAREDKRKAEREQQHRRLREKQMILSAVRAKARGEDYQENYDSDTQYQIDSMYEILNMSDEELKEKFGDRFSSKKLKKLTRMLDSTKDKKNAKALKNRDLQELLNISSAMGKEKRKKAIQEQAQNYIGEALPSDMERLKDTMTELNATSHKTNDKMDESIQHQKGMKEQLKSAAITLTKILDRLVGIHHTDENGVSHSVLNWNRYDHLFYQGNERDDNGRIRGPEGENGFTMRDPDGGQGGFGTPYYSQKDPRWSGINYNKLGRFGITGCGPTAMSMIAGGFGKNINPAIMGAYAKSKGYSDSTGTNWNFVNSASNAAGLRATQSVHPSESFIMNELANGRPVLLSGAGGYDTPYTNAGHYVVATGLDANGNPIISDPRGPEYSGIYSAKSTLNSTNSAWRFKRGGFGLLSGIGKVANIVGDVKDSKVGSWLSNAWDIGSSIYGKASEGYNSLKDILLGGNDVPKLVSSTKDVVKSGFNNVRQGLSGLKAKASSANTLTDSYNGALTRSEFNRLGVGGNAMGASPYRRWLKGVNPSAQGAASSMYAGLAGESAYTNSVSREDEANHEVTEANPIPPSIINNTTNIINNYFMNNTTNNGSGDDDDDDDDDNDGNPLPNIQDLALSAASALAAQELAVKVTNADGIAEAVKNALGVNGAASSGSGADATTSAKGKASSKTTKVGQDSAKGSAANNSVFQTIGKFLAGAGLTNLASNFTKVLSSASSNGAKKGAMVAAQKGASSVVTKGGTLALEETATKGSVASLEDLSHMSVSELRSEILKEQAKREEAKVAEKTAEKVATKASSGKLSYEAWKAGGNGANMEAVLEQADPKFKSEKNKILKSFKKSGIDYTWDDGLTKQQNIDNATKLLYEKNHPYTTPLMENIANATESVAEAAAKGTTGKLSYEAWKAGGNGVSAQILLEQADPKFKSEKNKILKSLKKSGIDYTWDDKLTKQENIDKATKLLYEKNHPNGFVSPGAASAADSVVEVVDGDGSIIVSPRSYQTYGGSRAYSSLGQTGLQTVETVETAPKAGKFTLDTAGPNANFSFTSSPISGKTFISGIQNGSSILTNGLTVDKTKKTFINPLLKVGAVGINPEYNGGVATVSKNTKTVGQAVYGAIQNSLAGSDKKAANVVAKGMEKLSNAKEAFNLTKSNVKDAFKFKLGEGANKFKNGVSSLFKKGAKEVAEEGTKEATEKVTNSLAKKFITKAKDILKLLISKCKSFLGKAGQAALEKALNSKIIGKLTEKAIIPFAEKISAMLAKIAAKTGTEAVTLGIGTAVFATYGGITGALDATNLFHVNSDGVTAPMRTISAILKAWIDASPVVGPVFDLLCEIFESIADVDAKSVLASQIYIVYCNIFDKEAGEAFNASQTEFKEEYSTFKSNTGLNDLAENTYNDKKHKTTGTKILEGFGSFGSSVGKFFTGSDAKDYYTDPKTGITYLDNGDGTYTVSDKDDDNYGSVSALPENTKKTHVKAKKGVVGYVKSGAKAVGDFASDRWNDVTSFFGGKKKKKNTIKVSDAFNKVTKTVSGIGATKALKKQVFGTTTSALATGLDNLIVDDTKAIYYTLDEYAGCYYQKKSDGKGYELINANGDRVLGEDITNKQLKAKLKRGLVKKDTKSVKKVDILGSFKSAVNSIPEAWKKSAQNTKDQSKEITNIFKTGKNTLSNISGKIWAGIKNTLTTKKETRYYDPQGNYYVVSKGNVSFYSPTDALLNNNISIDDFTKLVPTLKEKKVTVEKKQAKETLNKITKMKNAVTSTFSTGLKMAKEIFVLGKKDVDKKLGTTYSSVKQKGITGFLSSLGKAITPKVVDTTTATSFEGYVSPDGSYYVREKEGWAHYSSSHSCLEKGITDQMFNERYKPLLTYKKNIQKPSGIAEGFKKIQDSISSAWSKSSNIVSKGWSSFTKWISGKGESINKDIAGVTSVGKDNGGKGGFASIMGGKGDEANNFPYFSQKDARWGNTSYSANDGGTLADNGCGPTAMAMIVKGMRGDVNPKQIADYTKAKGYNDSTGTNWNFVSDTANQYGLRSAINIKPTQKTLDSQIANGPVLLSGRGGNGTPYTNAGHYVVAVGKDRAGNYIINDPRGKQYSGKYSAKDLVNSTNAAWSFTNGGRGTVRMSRILGGKGGNNFTAADVIAVAKNEVGYVEKASNNNLDSKTGNAGSSNYTKYERDVFGSNGNYWCASFVSWCFYTAAGKNKNKATSILLSLTRSADGMMTAFKNKNQFTTSNPQPGDVIFFSGSRHAGANHVGIVTNVDGGKVYTVEGNTSVGAGVVDNGGGVAEKSYDLSTSRILGYGRPNYDGTSNFSGIDSSDSSSNSSSESATALDRITSIFDDALDSGVWKSWGFTSNPFEDSSNSSSSSSDSSSSSSSVTSLSGSSIKNMTGSSFRTADLKSIPFASQEQIASALKGAFINGHPTSVFTSANLDKDAKGIYEAQGKSGLSALVPLAIGALESGWGTSNIARNKGNLWGWGAVNSNPYGGAKSFNPNNLGESFGIYSSNLLDKYYTQYGAKSIDSIGTGNNPAKKGYAYNDNGSISTTWAPSVESTGTRILKAMGVGGGKGDGLSVSSYSNYYIPKNNKPSTSNMNYHRNSIELRKPIGGYGGIQVGVVEKKDSAQVLEEMLKFLEAIATNTGNSTEGLEKVRTAISGIKASNTNNVVNTTNNVATSNTTTATKAGKGYATAKNISRGR